MLCCGCANLSLNWGVCCLSAASCLEKGCLPFLIIIKKSLKASKEAQYSQTYKATVSRQSCRLAGEGRDVCCVAALGGFASAAAAPWGPADRLFPVPSPVCWLPVRPGAGDVPEMARPRHDARVLWIPTGVCCRTSTVRPCLVPQDYARKVTINSINC